METAPHVSLTWGKYEQNVVSFVDYFYLLTFAYKWHGEKKMYVRTLADFPRFKKNHRDDTDLVKELWNLFNEADAVIAHFAVGFDYKMSRAFFLRHKLHPHSPVKVIDTKQMAKSVGRFPSNKLDDLGDYLGVGRKIHTDKSLWEGCMNGNRNSFKKMGTYNKQDVLLLERVYNILLPWATHPNVNVLEGHSHACPKCGSDKIRARGIGANNTRVFTRYQCQSCFGWFQSLTTIRSGVTTK